MKKLLEKQIRNIESELESVENAEKRIELRISFACLLYTSPSPRDLSTSRMPSSA